MTVSSSPGQLVDLPIGLIARAEARCLMEDLRGCENDLEESVDICTRCELRLLEADAHLAYTRLHLANDNPAAARSSLHRADFLVKRTGYYRRKGDLAELETLLK